MYHLKIKKTQQEKNEKNDWYVNDSLIKDALQYGTPDHIAYYKKSLLKASRLALKGGSGEWRPRFNIEGQSLINDEQDIVNWEKEYNFTIIK